MWPDIGEEIANIYFHMDFTFPKSMVLVDVFEKPTRSAV